MYKKRNENLNKFDYNFMKIYNYALFCICRVYLSAGCVGDLP